MDTIDFHSRDARNALNFLLGYHKPETWADALIMEAEYKEIFYKLMKEQENVYAFNLTPDVEEAVRAKICKKYLGEKTCDCGYCLPDE